MDLFDLGDVDTIEPEEAQLLLEQVTEVTSELVKLKEQLEVYADPERTINVDADKSEDDEAPAA